MYNSGIIGINRDGIEIREKDGIDEKNMNFIASHGLPNGDVENGAFKLSRIKNQVYLSLTEFDQTHNTGIAAIIKYDNNSNPINPFALIPILEKMIDQKSLDEAKEIKATIDKIFPPIKLEKGTEYIVSSILLQQRVIVVSKDYDKIIQFLGSIYNVIPQQFTPYVECLTKVKSIDPRINLQGIIDRGDGTISRELDRVKRDSCIVLLDKNVSFGIYSSPFTKKIARMYQDGKYQKIKEEIIEFLAFANEPIESSREFANKHDDLKVSDAKLLKNIQRRQEEVKQHYEEFKEMVK